MAAFQNTFYRCFIEDNRWRYLTRGLGNTLLITFFALLIGVALGVVVAIVRTSWDKNRAASCWGWPTGCAGSISP